MAGGAGVAAGSGCGSRGPPLPNFAARCFEAALEQRQRGWSGEN